MTPEDLGYDYAAGLGSGCQSQQVSVENVYIWVSFALL